MRKFFSILSLVLITSALCAKAFIPLVEFEHLGGNLQFGWVEGQDYEIELEEFEEQENKLEPDGPSFVWLPGIMAHCAFHPGHDLSTAASNRNCTHPPHCPPYLLFSVLRL